MPTAICIAFAMGPVFERSLRSVWERVLMSSRKSGDRRSVHLANFMGEQMQPNPNQCPDCDPALDRRSFLASLAASGLGASLFSGSPAFAAPSPKSTAEIAVKAFYDTLSAKQKETICF